MSQLEQLKAFFDLLVSRQFVFSGGHCCSFVGGYKTVVFLSVSLKLSLDS